MIVPIANHPEFVSTWNTKVKYYNQLASTLNEQQLTTLRKLIDAMFSLEQIACDVAYNLNR